MAHNGMGEGPYSTELTIYTDDVPGQARDLANVSVAAKQIKLEWA